MSIFDRLTRRKTNTVQEVTKTQTVCTEAWRYYSYNGEVFKQDLIVACIDALARNIAKADLRAIRKTDPNVAAEAITTSDVARVLRRPNEYMTQYDFLYKIASLYFTTNNVFIWPEYEDNKLKALWPINYKNFRLVEHNGVKIAEFKLNYFKTYYTPYKNLIHLRNHFFEDSLFGDGDEPLNPTLELANAQNQGIINGIKNSALIRGILTSVNVLKPEDMDAARAQFIEDNLKMENSNGVMVVDGKFTYKDIESKPYVVDADTMKVTQEKVFSYFGVNEKFLQNNFTSEDYEAVYEGRIEPFVIMLDQAMTAILYTDTEKGHGNSIEASMNRVKYQSTASAVRIINATKELGLFRRDEYREMLGYQPLGPENGGNDILIATNNYTTEESEEGENNNGGENQ